MDSGDGRGGMLEYIKFMAAAWDGGRREAATLMLVTERRKGETQNTKMRQRRARVAQRTSGTLTSELDFVRICEVGQKFETGTLLSVKVMHEGCANMSLSFMLGIVRSFRQPLK